MPAPLVGLFLKFVAPIVVKELLKKAVTTPVTKEVSMEYIKNRLSERSTWFGLAGFLVGGACYAFPEYTGIITSVAGFLGVGVAALPTGGKAD